MQNNNETLRQQGTAATPPVEPSIVPKFQDLQLSAETMPEDGMSLSQGSSSTIIDAEMEDALLGETKGTVTKPPKTQEQKRLSQYKSSRKFLVKLAARDANTLTPRDLALQKKHTAIVKKYEEKQKQKPGTNPTQSCSTPSTSKGFKASAPALAANSTTAATKTISDQTTKACLTKQDAVKRQRSSDQIGEETKRTKLSVSFTSPPELRIAIVDRSHPDGKISDDNWLKLEAHILTAMTSDNATSESCNFDGAKWHKGVKIVGCGNKQSLEFVTQCVKSFTNAWPDAQLDVLPASCVPLRKIGRLWVPPPLLEDSALIPLIGKQNGNLDTKTWQIISVKLRTKGDGKDYLITIDEKSFLTLKETAGAIKFGLGNLRIVLPDDTTQI